LLATGGMMMSIGHQQVKITTQIENITEKLGTLTDNIKEPRRACSLLGD
jgi:hypothetical protein